MDDHDADLEQLSAYLDQFEQTDAAPEENWFKDGLRFECLKDKCDRNCCKVQGPAELASLMFAGVSISNAEIAIAAEAANMPEAAFRDQHVTTARGIQSLKVINGACTFHDAPSGLCSLWAALPEAVPSKCRSWMPFSSYTLASEQFWNSCGENCPGVGQGPVISEAEILQKLRDTAPPYYPADPGYHERMLAASEPVIEMMTPQIDARYAD
jgi:hypothetical protein